MVTFDRFSVEVGEPMPWKKPPLLSVIVLPLPLIVRLVNCWVVERLALLVRFTTEPSGAGNCAMAGRAGSSKIEQQIATRPSADADAHDSKRRRADWPPGYGPTPGVGKFRSPKRWRTRQGLLYRATKLANRK